MDEEQVRRVLRDPLAQDLLASSLLARLAYVATDGSPRVVPIGYLWERGSFVMCTPPRAPKVRAMVANPSVALTVDSDGQPPRVLLVRGEATVTMERGVPDEFLAASQKYLPPETWESFGAQSRGLYARMARIVVRPRWVKLLDFETRFPEVVEDLIVGGRT